MARFALLCLAIVLCTAPAAFAKKKGSKDPGGYHDPIFVSFAGDRYEFMGEVGKVYNIISEQDTQVNSEFIDLKMYHKAGESHADKGTYFGAIGVMTSTDKVAVRPGFGNRVEVSVNGVSLDLTDMKGATQVSTPDGTVVKLFSRNRDVPDTVQVSTAKLALTLSGGGHHLNLAVDRIAGELCDVHGILGQTYQGVEVTEDSARPEKLRHNSFVLEGMDADYEVSALFATNSKFNRFGVAPTKCPKSTITGLAGTVNNRKMLASAA